MGNIEKTVFISYRRVNSPWALAIWQALTRDKSYDVFLDCLSLGGGPFEKELLENVQTRAHFVLLLTPSALERCNEPGDFLRREIETAIEYRRNIVPLMMEGFSFGTPSIANQLTGTLATVKQYQALSVPIEYFPEAMERLRNTFLQKKVGGVTHSPSVAAMNAAARQNKAAGTAPKVQNDELRSQQYFEQAYAHSDLKEKIRLYTQAIELNTDFMQAFNNRGLAWRAKRDLDRAIADFSRAIGLNPNDFEVFNNRGAARHENGDWSEAFKDYTRAISLRPNDAEVFYNRAHVRLSRKDLEGAIADFTEAISLGSGNSEVYLYRGIARKKKSDLEGALSDYTEAIRLKPDAPQAFINRGMARKQKGDLDGALADYDEAIHLKPDYFEAFYCRAEAHHAKGEVAGAIIDFQQFLGLGGGGKNGNTEEIEVLIRQLGERLNSHSA